METPIASRDWVAKVVRAAREEIANWPDLSSELRIVSIDYGRIAHSHKLLEEKCRMLERKIAEKDERIRKLILNGADPAERKRLLEGQMPAEYRGDWKRKGGHGD